ncbi:hypothetical protein BD560DRAFT_434851 [Blakeslea trispora]|nr:hypothetical protein BD560DRAFT_434851 [Blakeslea trispora]
MSSLTTRHHFSTRPKVHYLHHLHEDILRFGCALKYETEKGEMYNKFIREQLFHTNRHSPSKDVAVRFWQARSVTTHYRRWLLGEQRRQQSETIFGVRGLSDPGYDPVKGKLEPRFSGVFEDEYENRFVGVVKEDGVSVRKYTVAARRSESLLECQATDEVFELVALQPSGILDTHSASPTINLYVNLFKFGTITLLNSCNIYSYH